MSTTAPQSSTPPRPDDPNIVRISTCQKCKQPMGAIRVYEATQAGTQHMRGRIVQTCTDGRCHWTHFHTQVSYHFEDADNLVKRVYARENGVPLPQEICDAPLRVVQPLVPPEPGAILCRGSCTSKSGGKPRGAQMCIELKCKSCCRNAALEARENKTSRAPCKTHQSAAVYAASSQVNAANVASTSTPSVLPGPPPILEPTLPSSIPQPSTQQVVPASGPSHDQATVSLPATVPSTLLASSQTVNLGNRKKQLAQPCGPNWLANKITAEAEHNQAEELKTRRIKMEEELKRTVDLTIYYQADAAPITLPCFVDTYPKLRLESIPLLVAQLKLEKQTLFNYWTNHHWETITPSSIILVDKARPVILRCRPSLLEEIPLSNCPGISDLIKSLPRPKRAADVTLVSPLRKSQRDSDQESVHRKSDEGYKLPSTEDLDITSSNNSAAPLPTALPATSSANSTISRNETLAVRLPQAKGLNGLSVFAWDKGWNDIKELLDSNPNMTEATAFPEVFGFKYVKSSVCNYKKVWKQAPSEIKDQFIAHRHTTQGSWQNFATAIKKATVSSGLALALPSTANTPPPLQPTESPSSVTAPASHRSFQPTAPSIDSPPAAELSNISRVNEEPITAVTAPYPPREALPNLEDDTVIPPPFVALANPPHSPVASSIPPQGEPFPMLSPLVPEFTVSDFIFKSEDIEPVEDPTTLCSFCDRKLPETPSAKLVKMRASLDIRTWLSPTPENPLHRTARNFQVYIAYCTRHIFETNLLPLAVSENWPLQPDFSKIFDRVCRDYLALSTVAQSGLSEFLIAAKEHYNGASSRQEGILSQFASGRFLESGAGYYGETGYQIIISALRHLFPPQSVNLIDIHPLKYETFLQEVLAHEAAAKLIQVDLDIGYPEAVEAFRKSCAFGNHMHESDDTDNEPYIAAAVHRAAMCTPHSPSDFRRWIQSGSPLSIDSWVEEQKQQTLTEEELRIKQEEMDMDPFADEGDESLLGTELVGGGISLEDPIDLTLD